MKTRIVHWVPTIFWLTCAGALVAGVGVESNWGADWQKPIVRKKFGANVNNDFDLVPPFKLAAMEAILPETVDRPLMTPTRRPAPPPLAPVAAAPSMVRGQFTLKGTLINAGLTTAYLFETATRKTFGVKKGDAIPGKNIVLFDVANNSAVLKQGDDTESIELPRSSDSPRNPFPQNTMAQQGQPGFNPNLNPNMNPNVNSNGVPFPQQAMQQPNMPQIGAGPAPAVASGQLGVAGVTAAGATPSQPAPNDQVPGRRRFQNFTPPPQ